MFRYAQININGCVISDSHLHSKVEKDDMIPIDEKFDLTNKKYENGEWVNQEPEYVEPEPSNMELFQAETLLNQMNILIKQDESEIAQAELLLNQADIIAKQAEQDEVLAELLLNGLEV